VTPRAGPQMLAVRDPDAALSCLAAACLALEFVSQPETFPVFLADLRATNTEALEKNPDISDRRAYIEALGYLDQMFGLLGGHDD
jgi:hypothetical protein